MVKISREYLASRVILAYARQRGLTNEQAFCKLYANPRFQEVQRTITIDTDPEETAKNI